MSSWRAAVLDGDRKLLVAADGTMSARDLRADAAELRPLEATPDEVARAAALDHVAARAARSAVLDPAAVARLRALGYVDPRAP